MIRTQYSFTRRLSPPSKLKSLTLPDQTLPLRTILERYARGIPINSVPLLEDTDEEDEDYHEFTKLDKIEKVQYVRDYGEYVKTLKDRAAKEEREAAEAKAREAGQKEQVGRKTQNSSPKDSEPEGEARRGNPEGYENFPPKANDKK